MVDSFLKRGLADCYRRHHIPTERSVLGLGRDEPWPGRIGARSIQRETEQLKLTSLLFHVQGSSVSCWTNVSDSKVLAAIAKNSRIRKCPPASADSIPGLYIAQSSHSSDSTARKTHPNSGAMKIGERRGSGSTAPLRCARY